MPHAHVNKILQITHDSNICTGMGYFSNKLAELVERHGSAQAVADLSGLARSSISRFVNDKMLPDPASLEKLCSLVEESEAADLIDAFLRDQIPDNLRYLVRITPNTTRVREDEPMPAIYNRLKPETRAMLHEIARLALEDDQVADAFSSMLRAISSSWAKREDLRQVEELGTAITRQSPK